MSRHLIVQGGVVVGDVQSSGITAQEIADANPGTTVVAYDGPIERVVGMTWTGSALTGDALPMPEPSTAPPVPQSVTMRQARLALLAASKLAAVDLAIASLPSPQKEAAQIEWEYAATVERTSPLIEQLAPALGLTEAEMDALFASAAEL